MTSISTAIKDDDHDSERPFFSIFSLDLFNLLTLALNNKPSVTTKPENYYSVGINWIFIQCSMFFPLIILSQLHFVSYNTKYDNLVQAIDQADGLAVLGLFIQVTRI